MKKQSVLSVVVGLLLMLAARRSIGAEPEGLFVTHIAIDPVEPRTLYVTTGFSVGVFKSSDGGEHWTQLDADFKSHSFTRIFVDPAHHHRLFLADGCAGLYVSEDAGQTWKEMNDGLQDTEIGAMALHPSEEGSLFAMTTQGVYKAEASGKRWLPFNQGDTFTSGFDFIGVIAVPTRPVTLFMASKQGLYTRSEGDPAWLAVGGPFEGKQISAVAYDPKGDRIYVAVFRRGKIETLREGGLFVSEDRGGHWSRLGPGLEQERIRVIGFDPSDSRVLYVGTSGGGIFKSLNGGRSWKQANAGLTDPNRDVRSLAIDPQNPKVLYAGSYGRWVFRSVDAAEHWAPLSIGPHRTAEQILAGLSEEHERAGKARKVSPPPAFSKCNQCHGWTDPSINLARPSLWMVPVNRRDWAPTVKRMRKGAGLTDEEERTIIDFLQSYSEKRGGG